MIVSFHDRITEAIYNGVASSRFPVEMQAVARRKLRMLNNARHLGDLKIPPSNHLERLKRDRDGQWSIRINKQWRICFIWDNGNAERVEICDYH